MVAVGKGLNMQSSRGAQRCARVQSATISHDARSAERRRLDPEQRARRAFWLHQARFALRRAREWRQRFGGYLHHVALYWYLDELETAARYHRWAHGDFR